MCVFDSHAAPLASEIMTDWFVLKIIVRKNLQCFTNKTTLDSPTLFWVYNFEISFLNITGYNLPNRVESISRAVFRIFLARYIFVSSQRIYKGKGSGYYFAASRPSRRSPLESKRKSCRIYSPYSSLTIIYPSFVEELAEWRHMCVLLSKINIVKAEIVYPPRRWALNAFVKLVQSASWTLDDSDSKRSLKSDPD